MPDRELVFTGRKFHVERCRFPAGNQTHSYEIIRHTGAAVILPVLPDGRIVFERNYRYPVEQTLLELPAGTLDPPEDPATCAHRELAEETGYRAGRLEPLLSFYSTPGVSDEVMHAFLATDLTAGQPQLEAGEQITLEPIPLDTALAMISQGEIRDAKTIATVLFYATRAQAG
jgi:ADP-ribose pyrophosphatase